MSEHIRVSSEKWKRLNRLKQPGDAFDDVVGRLLDYYEEHEGQEETGE